MKKRICIVIILIVLAVSISNALADNNWNWYFKPTPTPSWKGNSNKVTWKCVDATSYDGNAYNDNKCTSSTGQVRYVSDSILLTNPASQVPGITTTNKHTERSCMLRSVIESPYAGPAQRTPSSLSESAVRAWPSVPTGSRPRYPTPLR